MIRCCALVVLTACALLATNAAAAPIKSLQFGRWKLAPVFTPARLDYGLFVPNNLNILPVLAIFDPSSKCTLTNTRNETIDLINGTVTYVVGSVPGSMKIIIVDTLGDTAKYTFKFEGACGVYKATKQGENLLECPPERSMLLRGGATCVAQNINPGLSQPAGERGWKALCEWRESEVTVLCCDPDSMAPVIAQMKCKTKAAKPDTDRLLACDSPSQIALSGGATCFQDPSFKDTFAWTDNYQFDNSSVWYSYCGYWSPLEISMQCCDMPPKTCRRVINGNCDADEVLAGGGYNSNAPTVSVPVDYHTDNITVYREGKVNRRINVCCRLLPSFDLQHHEQL